MSELVMHSPNSFTYKHIKFFVTDKDIIIESRKSTYTLKIKDYKEGIEEINKLISLFQRNRYNILNFYSV